MKEKFESYDFIAEDGTRHQDIKSVRAVNEIYWEYMHPKKINQTQSRELELDLKRNLMNIDFREWDSYCTLLVEAVKSRVVSLQDIVRFAQNLRSASVMTTTIPEHEEYLRSIKMLDLLIDTISREQAQARK